MTQWDEPLVYAVKHWNEDVRMHSRSGGMFTALSDLVFDLGGVVYGCILNEQLEACHIRAADARTRDQMRGSKYIQSQMSDCFRDAQEDLDSGKYVLFTGTPCQVSGLKGFLHRDYDRLLLVDILCHGVASEKVWKKYIAWMEQKYGECTGADFRDKKNFGWADHVETLTFGQKQVHSKIFAYLYYGHAALRPCCYSCSFKSVHRVSDLTIADYWEIDRACPGFNDNKGVSLVYVNNTRGNEYFEKIKPQVEWKETRLEDSIRPSMLHPASEPSCREQFWKDFCSKPFNYTAKKYGGYGLTDKMKKSVRRILKKIRE